MDPIVLTSTVVCLVGVLILVFFAMIAKSYVKAPANRAFVRTGGFFRRPDSPPKVVMNGGAWVFGFVHVITWVDLGTMAIEIERTEQNALLTKDPQYADIKAIFYIKVAPTVEGIIDAARTIGTKAVGADAVKTLVEAKLDGALRDVAATFTLMSLHQEREKFIMEVQNRVKGDLEENGLVLESVSILTLKAARQGSFGTDDVFGAQVARANAEVIQNAQRERNDIERKTEVEIKQRDTNTAKEKLALEQDLAFAAATQDREVRTRQSVEKSTADKAIYEQEQSAEQARIAKERAVKLTEIEMEQTILVQDERKKQEYQVAEIVKNQASEVAEQAKQIAVLNEQQKREAAERERLLVGAQREQAAQDVKTVEETAKAKREAQIQVIQAERDAQRVMIDRKNTVEIEALKKVREAEAQATALKQIAQAEFDAAQKQAETKRTQAQAESDAEKMLADAERARTSATGLAEAEVMRAKAEAIRQQGLAEGEAIKAKGLSEAEAVKAKGLAEAEGQKAKAEALAAFDNVSQQLELQRMQLEAHVQIGVARAQAVGAAIANMQIKMFGTPEAADSILRLMSFAEGMGDVMGAVPPQVRELGQQLLGKVTGDGKKGQTMTLEQAAELLPHLMSLVDRTLDVNKLKGQTVSKVLAQLEDKAAEADKLLVAQARAMVVLLPFLADANFEDIYLRYAAATK
jgi:flotillin